MADAGGRRRGSVLPLALAGLAALAHRGAFAADGESSDGAGVALPVEPCVVARLLESGEREGPATARRRDRAPARPGILMLFLPRDEAARARGHEMVREALASEGLVPLARRHVPVEPAALGRAARAARPSIEQLIVARPRGVSPQAFERRLLLARRRAESAARLAGLDGLSIPSASARSVVYKGLVAGSRLGEFYPDLAELPVSYAVFHQRYATNTTPAWRLAQPFRLIAHNGEINTVRGNREQVRGRRAAVGGRWGRRLTSAAPLLSEEGSDSLSLDEALDLLVSAGWPLPAALLALVPESPALRTSPHPTVEELQRRSAGLLAPWDGPAALVFNDGRRLGALLDRNGLRPAAYAVSRDGLVVLASEAGAVPLEASETALRGRLGPGEMLLVDPAAGSVRFDTDAKQESLAWLTPGGGDAVVFEDRPAATREPATSARRRWLAGLDAERSRLSIRTMALEAHEPLWSMGDDTPTPALARRDRPVADHLRQSFAQVTNPAIDPERERIVMEMAVHVGRRPRLLAGLPRRALTVRLPRPLVADLEGLATSFAGSRGRRAVRTLDATWPAASGTDGLAAALDRLGEAALDASRSGVELLVLSDRGFDEERLPIPSVLAVGAVHTALTDAGLRGETDVLADASDVLDVHTGAMALAAGATAVVPWLALEVAGEVAGERGAETLSAERARSNLLGALEGGLRKVLARMGISCVASYIGGQFFEVLELDESLIARCFPAAPNHPGRVGLAEVAARQLRRRGEAEALPAGGRLPDPGYARYRADGEAHLFAPAVVKATQALAAGDGSGGNGDAYRAALVRDPAVVRDQLVLPPAAHPLPVDAVEPVERLMRRFVGAAMSLGALSPEAHQVLTIAMRRIGAASNSGEGGEDPAWYDGAERRDSAIKQVASGRFGVTAAYLARGDQLEIKIAQGSKPGEGGQLPGKKVTAFIAALRRGRPGRSMISPPPHHDIYSIEDLAQLIADLRAVNPSARIGVKLVAAIGVGTIAAGVAKAGADYIQVSGHAGGTGASPLSSIKHAGIPWELGLAETHQVLVRNDLRDRVALRTDGGLQTGRDVVIAALLGAEEFGFGTAALVALGCDMARQCHLDTCPTGIATQREDLRAKFQGTPEAVERFFRAIAEDVRRELARIGCATLGEAIGAADRLAAGPGATLDLRPLLAGPAWTADRDRREDAAAAARVVPRAPASATEERLLGPGAGADGARRARARISTADRSVGARLSGALESGAMRGPVTWELEGAAGQSLGAFLAPGATVVLTGQANDYVGKGLSGGVLVVRPEPELLATARDHAVVGNTCLYGATGGRLHVVGRAAMRFAVRNSGAEAVVEGIGPHGCAYMTGGTVVILGTAGGNLGAGMTGGRVFLDDSSGGASARVDAASVRVERLASVRHRRDAPELFADLLRLLRAHADAGSSAAREMLSDERSLGERVLLIESLSEPSPGEDRPGDDPVPAAVATAERRERGRHAFAPTPAA